MAQIRQKEMTADEFLIWCLDQEERYELVDGFPVPLRAMAGASRTHDRIAINLIARLENRLAGGPCVPTTADTALRTSIKRVRRPDVTVECSPPDSRTYEATSPVAVFEILSPTTRKSDRTIKLTEYFRHPMLRTIVYIDPDAMDVVVWSKVGAEWVDRILTEPDDRVLVAGPDVDLTLAEIYHGVVLTPPAANEP